MTDFDNRLRTSLGDDDQKFLKDLEDDRGLFTQLGATFHGPMRFWTRIVFVVTFLISAFAFYAGYQALTVEPLRETVLWAAATVASFNGVSMLKQWLFSRMNHLAVLRELKKIELRLANEAV